jgi:hypothetical protein
MLGLAVPARPQNIAFNHINSTFTYKDSKVRLSYRQQPSDGQFAGHRSELCDYSVGFILPTLDSVAEAFMAHEKSKGVEWFYEWNIPHTSSIVYTQFVNDGFVPPRPELHSLPQEPMVEVPLSSNAGGSHTAPEARKTLTELRDVLGADFGSMLDAHASMASLAGKQLPKATYEANSRTLTGLLTAFEVSMVPYLMESPAALRTFLDWFMIACDDAREWDYRPTSKDQLIQQRALAATLGEANPFDEAPDAPLPEPRQAAIDLLAAQEPFNLNQPDPLVEAAATTHAATGEPQPPGSTLEDFATATNGSTQTPAAAAPPAHNHSPAQPVGFTAPPPA